MVESRPLYLENPPATSTENEDRKLITRRQVIHAAAAVAVTPLAAKFAWAQDVAPLPDMILGDPEAPVEIIEYSSMTCPYCATFHTQTLPTIKERYLDTGKAKLVFREFPLDRVALTASAIARCIGDDGFFPFVDVLYKTQATWATAQDSIAEIKKLVRMGGLDPAMVDSCLQDQSVIDGILAVRLEGDQTYNINSTPTFIINGDKYPGHMSVEEFETVLEPYLTES